MRVYTDLLETEIYDDPSRLVVIWMYKELKGVKKYTSSRLFPCVQEIGGCSFNYMNNKLDLLMTK